MPKALSFEKLWVGMKVRVMSGKTITHDEHQIVPENTIGFIEGFGEGDSILVHWEEDPLKEPLTRIHSHDIHKLCCAD